jgi:flagellar FliJ protein
MTRFRFRLETLRRLREMNRDELRGRLAEAFRAEQILREQQATVAAEAASLAETRRKQVAAGEFDVTRMLEAQRYQLLLEAQQRSLSDQAIKLAGEVEIRRQAVVEADREVRVLDKLRERRAAEHRAAAERAENKVLDDIATTRWEYRSP